MEIDLVNGGPLSEYKREELVQHISGSWKARSIFALLELPKYQKNPREMAAQLALTLDDLFFYLDMLEAVSFIRKDGSGSYQRLLEELDFRALGLDATGQLRNFSLMTAEILSRQTTTGRCRHVSAVVYSNYALVKAFMIEVENVTEKFEKASKASNDKSFLLGMTTAYVDLIDGKKLGSEQ